MADGGSFGVTYCVGAFDLGDMLRCGLAVRREVRGAPTLEEAARRVVRFFHEQSVDETGERCCALVRLYKTHPLGALDAELRAFAERVMPDVTLSSDTACLTLLATAGDDPAWNDRRRSRGHQAIPLPSPEMVEQAPMIAQLITEMGLDITSVVRSGGSGAVLASEEQKSYRVFHVEDALGSPHIPAQDFVERYGVRSVLGFGGVLRGELFAVILFSRAHIPRSSAERFRTIALDLKSALFAIEEGRVFD